MPRAENLTPAGLAKAKRMAKYRAWLKKHGRPEASKVDIALAASAAAYADTVNLSPAGSGDFRTALTAIIRGTVDILVKRGCTREEAVHTVRWRVSRESRKDLGELVSASRMPKRLGVSP
ncbi:hypothetical protein [Mesorhizobium sp. M8A.F.Ca.ET.207.01.1.1]|uniref:hypothetical protein n=1 Tax=Mesorhizobium sp. M8A.F.Ca.ET.207.01.1.1 TaxID=2563968 RepID=UPI00109C42FE|nr:hypothetical protein [Mesorhizobium sp. M8A.F.Ca.ET.207.01.1.1]